MKFWGFFSLIFISISAQALVLQVSPKELLKTDSAGALEICWLGKVDSETVPLRLKIQKYLTSQLTGRAGIQLKFFDNCFTAPDPMFPVDISFFDALDNPEGIKNGLLGATAERPETRGHPTTYHRGAVANKDLFDVVLTSHFADVDPGLTEQAKNLTTEGRDNLRLSIALHEFLHAMGMDHEQNRLDTKCEIQVEYSLTSTVLTEYDPVSIMNYCYTHTFDFSQGPMALSALDIAGLQKVYAFSIPQK